MPISYQPGHSPSKGWIDRSPPGYRPPPGAIWLDGDRLEERCWNHLRDLLSRTGTLTRTWMGFSWQSQGEVRCELQRDEGYDGIVVRIEVTPEQVGPVRETAVALGGGAGLAEP
jgi:hypothetical protein